MPVEELTVTSGDIELSGSLITPEGDGPFPLVVVLHNASRGTRSFLLYDHLREVLLPRGIAVFVHDRRGEGTSGGDADAATLEDKAQDVIAWVDLLSAHPAVDPDRIGFWGHSQGGWIGPMTAAVRPKIATMICVSAAAVTPGVQMCYAAHTQILEQGFSEEDADRAVAMRQTVDEYFRGNGSKEAAIEAIDAVKSEPWFPTAFDIDPRREGTESWSEEVDYDISPVLRRLRLPCLLIFGETDRWQPADQTAEIWRDSLPEGVELVVEKLQGAGHTPTLAKDPRDTQETGPISPQYEQLVVDWFTRHLGV
ncbi:MAG: alpha/beta fold hydrolase [Conexibacter sp.]